MDANGRRKSSVFDLPSRTECCPEPGCLEEDKEIASEAVLFVINGARKGTVHLCSSVAALLRENRRLQRALEVHRAQIRYLRGLSPLVSLPGVQASTTASSSGRSSLSFSPNSLDRGISSSSSSGRGSLSPSLPRLHAPLQEVLQATRRVAAVNRLVEESEHMALEAHVPLTCPCPGTPRFPRRDKSSAHTDVGRRRGGSPQERLTPENDVQPSGRKQKQKTKNIKVVNTEGVEMESADLGVKQGRASPQPGSNKGTAARGLSRKKHKLKLNETKALEKQEDSTCSIGSLGNPSTSEDTVGVELDTGGGENDGSLPGITHPKCSSFATVSQSKQPSKPAVPPGSGVSLRNRTDSSDSDTGRPYTRDGPKNSRLRRTKNRNISAMVHLDSETRLLVSRGSGAPLDS